jgi:hypothetical protein
MHYPPPYRLARVNQLDAARTDTYATPSRSITRMRVAHVSAYCYKEHPTKSRTPSRTGLNL